MAQYRGWLLIRAGGEFAGLPLGVSATRFPEAGEEWRRRIEETAYLRRLIYSEDWLTPTPGTTRRFTPPQATTLPPEVPVPSSTQVGEPPYSADSNVLLYTSATVEEITEEQGRKEVAEGIVLDAVVYRTEFSFVQKGGEHGEIRLPEDALRDVIEVARRSDCLILGECHGSREVPQLVSGLLDALSSVGYGALAMEMPRSEQEAIMRWAAGKTEQIPPFFTEPPSDGRNNVQTLDLFRKAVEKGWQVLCFDVDDYPDSLDWEERDRMMADAFKRRWDQSCPGKKAVAVCGNLHSRLEPADGDSKPSRSFAVQLREGSPQKVFHSVEVHQHGGSSFNGGREIFFLNSPLDQIKLCEDRRTGHSYVLHLPHASPATFLTPPAEESPSV